MTKTISQLTSGTPAAGDVIEFETSGGLSRKCDITALAGFPNRAFSDTLVNTSGTTLIPVDATIPQITEGTEFLSVSITPTSNTARVRVEVVFYYQNSSANNAGTIALFINGGSNAVRAASSWMATANGGNQLVLEYEYVPGSTSAQTLSVRGGPNSGGTFAPNTPSFGGVMKSSIRAFEIA